MEVMVVVIVVMADCGVIVVVGRGYASLSIK